MWPFAAFTRCRHCCRSNAISHQSPGLSTPKLLTSSLTLSCHLRRGLPTGLLPSGTPWVICFNKLPSGILATCPAHLSLCDQIWFVIGGSIVISLNSELCLLLHSPVMLSLIGPHMRLSIPFSKTNSLRSNSFVSRQVSQP